MNNIKTPDNIEMKPIDSDDVLEWIIQKVREGHRCPDIPLLWEYFQNSDIKAIKKYLLKYGHRKRATNSVTTSPMIAVGKWEDHPADSKLVEYGFFIILYECPTDTPKLWVGI